MSPWPQAPGSASRLTKKRPFFPTGVGQKSSAAEFTGSPRFCGAPHDELVLDRVATQMSRPPFPPGRFEARYRLRLSGDSIGHPSSAGVFISTLLPFISSIFCALDQASADPVSVRTRATTNAAPSTRFLLR